LAFCANEHPPRNSPRSAKQENRNFIGFFGA
jgi:hypothetical protein